MRLRSSSAVREGAKYVMVPVVSCSEIFGFCEEIFIRQFPVHYINDGLKSQRIGKAMKKITPFLWFNGNAEEAMSFYVSIFKNSKVLSVSRSGASGPGPEGTVMSVNFKLDGQEFIALNGGPEFKFTPAVSLYVNCEDQEEVDALWKKLSKGGEVLQCGWVKDKFGMCWQIIPKVLGVLMGDKDKVKAARVMEAMLKMKKIETAKLIKAYGKK